MYSVCTGLYWVCACTYYCGIFNTLKPPKLSLPSALFLSRAAVLLHSGLALVPKPCFAVKLGFREIQVDVWTSDVMAGAGGAAGPAPDVQHQPEGTACHFVTSVMLILYEHITDSNMCLPS